MGVVDVVDCISGAKFLVARGDVDGSKLAVTGGSAGGYTTLCGLTFHTQFAVGASYYGISDLVALATETHKFELHYTDWLIELFRPNTVVPINQAQEMYSALQRRNIPTCLYSRGRNTDFRQFAHLRPGP